jgi:broad specificity phosphatase PhoE
MKIYLIRHGESISDAKGKYDGDYDDSLTENGLLDAKEAAKKLLEKNIQAIFSSPKIRAQETAAVLSDALHCEVIVQDDLQERDIYGAYPNIGKDYPEEEYRRLGELLADKESRIEGSESHEDFTKRVGQCFLDIVKHSEYTNIAIVTHGGPIRSIFREVLRLGEFKNIGNGAIIEIETSGDDFLVLQMDGASLSDDRWI